AVLPSEDGMQLRGEAHEARQGRDLVERLHLRRERRTARRAAGLLDGGDDAVDRRGAGDEPAGAGVDLLRQLVDRGTRIAAERVRVRHEEVVRDLRALRKPVRAVARPRVEDGRVVAERTETGYERRQRA